MSEDDKPFKVQTATGGTQLSEHMTEKEAEARCATANKSAEALKLGARYEVSGP